VISGVIAILEDDERRTAAMRECLASGPYPAVFFTTAPDMNAWLAEHLREVVLLSLDHDLGPSILRDGERMEPGDGRDVANFLAAHSPVCPVIVHTTNSMGAEGMLFNLGQAGWTTERIVPFDDLRWITTAWLKVVTAMLPR
jgi:hypothetical protein